MKIKERVLKGSIIILFCAVIFFVSPQLGQTTELLYGITFGEQLITIDTSTGSGTLVGNLDTVMDGIGLGTRAGKLYTFDQNGDLVRELDPSTAHTLNSINVGIANVGEGSLAFRGDGLGFLSWAHDSVGILHSFDITGPSSTIINSNFKGMDGLDFNSSNVLYGLSQGKYDTGGHHQLYTIDQVTGSVTLVGDTGIEDTGNPLAGLAFNSGGLLFAVMNDILYSVNFSTGATNSIGPIGFTNVSGLTFVEVEAGPVPEPATMLLLGSGLLGLAGYGRKKFFKK